MPALDRGLDALARVPWTPLMSVRPTPLQRSDRLRDQLGGSRPELWLKRDDESGFALGGNKVRKLEMELAPERLRGTTHLVTCGGPQSNSARLAAAAAATLGLQPVLIINGPADGPWTGNALLHRLFGARLVHVGRSAERAPRMEEVAEEIRRAGGRPLIVPLGASTPRGALGYARAAVEMNDQMPRAPGGARTWVVLASSSGGTLAGLAVGFTLLGRSDIRLLGVSADVSSTELSATAGEIARGALQLLNVETEIPDGLVHVSDDEVGEGYGIETAASREASLAWARSAGAVLDPVYTSKAASGLVSRVADGRLSAPDRVVFWHTGGSPALFR